MNKHLIITIALALFVISTHAQEKVIQLYPGKVPGSETWSWSEKVSDRNMASLKLVYDVSSPTLTVYPPAPGKANGTAVIICPGGGFQFLAIDHEGTEVAKWLNKKGITAFVLKYRVTKTRTDDPAKELSDKMGKKEFVDENVAVIPLAIADGKEAISYVRKHAADYNISSTRIGIIGFSAGGTVAASAAYDYTPENRPDFVAPIYAYMPPELQKEIKTDAPPMFLAAASDDNLGLETHSIDLYSKWIASKHSAELHIYSKGGHGFGMRKQNTPSDTWIERYADWLDTLGLLKAK